MEDVAPADKLQMTAPKQTGHPVDAHSLGLMASQDNKHKEERLKKGKNKTKKSVSRNTGSYC